MMKTDDGREIIMPSGLEGHDCDLCLLARGHPGQHRTRWFYIGDVGAVVEDLDPGDYHMRLLFVPSKHVIGEGEVVAVHQVAVSMLEGIGHALCHENPNLAIAGPARISGGDHLIARLPLSLVEVVQDGG
jgi:hypothetical protein